MQQSSKGRAFILVVILLVGIIMGFALLSARIARVGRAPTVQAAFWEVDGQKVTTTSVGVEVEAHVIIKATEEHVGSIVAEIRKDVAFWPDSNYHLSTMPLNLVGGQEKEIELIFVPDQPSGSSMRGYFIEIDFEATRTKWVMENSYPPRLRVSE